MFPQFSMPHLHRPLMPMLPDPWHPWQMPYMSSMQHMPQMGNFFPPMGFMGHPQGMCSHQFGMGHPGKVQSMQGDVNDSLSEMKSIEFPQINSGLKRSASCRNSYPSGNEFREHIQDMKKSPLLRKYPQLEEFACNSDDDISNDVNDATSKAADEGYSSYQKRDREPVPLRKPSHSAFRNYRSPPMRRKSLPTAQELIKEQEQLFAALNLPSTTGNDSSGQSLKERHVEQSKSWIEYSDLSWLDDIGNSQSEPLQSQDTSSESESYVSSLAGNSMIHLLLYLPRQSLCPVRGHVKLDKMAVRDMLQTVWSF